MPLRLANDRDLAWLMSWFEDETTTRHWGGPHFRFPFTKATFIEDSRYGDMPGFVLESDHGRRLAFGQYYGRYGRCHLARIAVAPDQRGSGYGGELILGMARYAKRDGYDWCTLYVMDANTAARALYQKLGFRDAEHPDGSPVPDHCRYLLARIDELCK